MTISRARVVLVGGAGLIGSHIVDRLLKEDVAELIVFDDFSRGTRDNLAGGEPRVKVVEGSMTDAALVDRTIAGADGVFLLASLWLGECVADPRAAWETNVIGSWNVVEACVAHQVPRLVYSSSASVYGDAVFTPMTEEHPFNNRTTYGATKIAVEQMLRAMHAQHGLPYVGLRYMNVYGPRMDYRGAYVSVIMKVLDRIFAGQPPVVFGDGSQVYDFVHVSDVAAANVLAMQALCTDEQFNIGCGVGTSIRELVDLLLALTGSSLRPEYGAGGQTFVTHRLGSTEKATALLGFTARTSLREGLQQVIDWRQRLAAGVR